MKINFSNNLKNKIKYIYILVIAVFFFAFGYFFGNSAHKIFLPASASDSPVTIPAVLSEVKNILDNQFISWRASSTLPTTEDLAYGMVKGYVDSYNDPYTTFFTPKEAKQFEENIKGSFGGIGAYIGYKDSSSVIISTIKDSPAEAAGIKSGDIIVSVNGSSTQNLSSDQVVSMVRGDVGTNVILEVLHKNDTKTSKITITRQVVNVPILDTEVKNGVYIIHFYSFTEDSATKFQSALQDFVNSGYKNLIVDLRGNGGGYLDSAVNIASLFLDSNKVIVVEKNSKTQNDQKDYSRGYNIFDTKNRKLVVLIDGGSASASEILAGALKDNSVATIVGEKSFGKGSVQQLEKLSDGSDLKVTVAKWYTPNGVNISESGINPDIVASSSQVIKTDKNGKNIDEQLNKAIDIIKNLK